jgi:leucyl-tRNA synthetase
MSRFLSGVWRTLVGEGPARRVVDAPIPEALDRMLHRTIKKVGADIEALRFNTGIAKLIELHNEMSTLPNMPRELAEKFVLLLAPFAPHIAEEIWQRLGHDQSLARQAWPAVDPAKLAEATMELPVQVNGKVRDKITVPSDAGEELILQAAQTAPKIRPWLAGKTIRKQIYIPNRLVNFVVS